MKPPDTCDNYAPKRGGERAKNKYNEDFLRPRCIFLLGVFQFQFKRNLWFFFSSPKGTEALVTSSLSLRSPSSRSYFSELVHKFSFYDCFFFVNEFDIHKFVIYYAKGHLNYLFFPLLVRVEGGEGWRSRRFSGSIMMMISRNAIDETSDMQSNVKNASIASYFASSSGDANKFFLCALFAILIARRMFQLSSSLAREHFTHILASLNSLTVSKAVSEREIVQIVLFSSSTRKRTEPRRTQQRENVSLGLREFQFNCITFQASIIRGS